MTLRRRDFSFRHFCEEVAGLDFMDALDAIAEEISSLREVAQWQGKQTVPLHGTPPRQYYDDLFLLMRLSMGTPLPVNVRKGYVDEAWPLLDSFRKAGLIVLEGLRPGTLPPSSFGPARWEQSTRVWDEPDEGEEEYDDLDENELDDQADHGINAAHPDVLHEVAAHVGELHVVVSRQEVELGSLRSVVASLKPLLSDPEKARTWRNRVDLSFSGFEADSRELFVIPQVREFMAGLDREFPLWFWFLRKDSESLKLVAACLCRTQAVRPGLMSIDQLDFAHFLMDHFRHFNKIAEWVGATESEVEAWSKEITDYFGIPE